MLRAKSFWSSLVTVLLLSIAEERCFCTPRAWQPGYHSLQCIQSQATSSAEYGHYGVFLFREILHHMLPMCWPSNNITSHQEKLNPKLVWVWSIYYTHWYFFLIFSPLVSISYQLKIPGFDLLNWLLPFLCPLKVLERTWCRFWQGPAKQSRSSYYQFCICHNAECGVLFGRILWVCWYLQSFFFCSKVALWAFWKGWRSQIVLDFCRLWPGHLSIVEGFVQLS